jgi:hypothetical protein
VNAVAELGRYRAVVLTTYRRDGTAVATPVWPVAVGERLYVVTASSAAKLGRIRHTARVSVAPSTQRGKVLGAAVEGRARILDAEEGAPFARAQLRRYRVAGRSFRLMDRLRGEREVVIEIGPSTE